MTLESWMRVKPSIKKSKPPNETEIALVNKDITAVIYAYCEMGPKDGAINEYDPLIHGRPKYVGQTIQTIRNRDTQHLYGYNTKFDQTYTDRKMYCLVILESKVFPAAEFDQDFKVQTP